MGIDPEPVPGAQASERPLPPRPEPPDPADCCGSGCVRCIHDIYEEALAHWERLVADRAKPPL